MPMNMQWTRHVALGIALLLTPHGASGQTTDDARAFVQGIYDRYIRTVGNGGDPDIPRTIYDPGMRKLWQRMDTLPGNCLIIGADPLIDAQDWMFKSVAITLDAAGPGHLRATVRFRNGPEDRAGTTVILDLVAIQGLWKIHNILDTTQGDLRSAMIAGLRKGCRA